MAPLAPQTPSFGMPGPLNFSTPKFATGVDGSSFMFKDGTTGSKTDFSKYTPPVNESFDWKKFQFDTANAPKVTGAMTGVGTGTEMKAPLPMTEAKQETVISSMEGRKNVPKTSMMDSIIPKASAMESPEILEGINSGKYDDTINQLSQEGYSIEEITQALQDELATAPSETTMPEEVKQEEGFQFKEYIPTSPKFQIDTTVKKGVGESNLQLAENMLKTIGNVPPGIWNTFAGAFNAVVNTAKDPEGMANAITEGIKGAYVEGKESIEDTYKKSGTIGVINKALEKSIETLGENPFETISVVKPTLGLKVMKESAKLPSKVITKLTPEVPEVVKSLSKAEKASLEAITPKTFTPTERTQLIKEGKLKTGKGLTGEGTEYIPGKKDIEIAKTASPYIQKAKSVSEKVTAIKKGIVDLAEQTKNEIKNLGDSIFNTKTIFKKLDSIERPVMIKSEAALNNAYNLVDKKMKDLITKSKKNYSSLLEVRKEFDRFVDQEFPDLYSNEKLTPMKSAIMNYRRSLNDFISEGLPEGNKFKGLLKDQSNLYEAIDMVAPQKDINALGKILKSPFTKYTAGVVGGTALVDYLK